MGMNRAVLVLLFALALPLAGARAQGSRTVEGKEYLVHTVAPGQTLYGIAKHYAVELDAVAQANPGAVAGLSIGQVLLIPTEGRSRKAVRQAPALQNGALVHTVSKRETLFGIAKHYGVGQEALVQANPDLAFGLRTGMSLRIPVSAVADAPPAATAPARSDNALFHQVLAGETLWSLSKRFGATPEQIKAANNGLPEGLKAGLYIRLPDTVPTPADTAIAKAVPMPPAAGHLFKVAVLLPFTATARDTADGAPDGGPSQVTDAAMEFRAGMALALDSLEARGLHADVNVFDSGTRPAQWDALFRSDALRGMDLYLGPFHRSALEGLVRISGQAPVVCPVPQSNKVLLGNPTVIKAVSSRSDQVKQLARYAMQHRNGARVLMLRPAIPAERDLQDLVLRELRALPPALPADSVRPVACGRRDVAALLATLTADRMNFVVVPSEDVEFVTATISALTGAASRYPITVFGLDSWRSIPTLDVTALMRLNLHLPASTAVDRNDARVQAFINAYRDRFRNDPGDYAFLGYDVTLFFLQGLMRFGQALPAHLNEVTAEPLHMGFRFGGLGAENGMCNTSAVMEVYTSDGIRYLR